MDDSVRIWSRRRTARSKPDGLGMNTIPQGMVKGRVFNDVDSATEGFLKIGNESAGEKRSGPRAGFDQEIEIAVGPGPVVCEGTENLDARHSVMARDGEYALAFGRSEFDKSHRSYVS